MSSKPKKLTYLKLKWNWIRLDWFDFLDIKVPYFFLIHFLWPLIMCKNSFLFFSKTKTLLFPGQDVIARFPFFLTKWSFKNKVLADFEIKCDDETQSLKKKENKFLLIILTTLNIYFWIAQTEASLNSYLSFIIFRKQKFCFESATSFLNPG